MLRMIEIIIIIVNISHKMGYSVSDTPDWCDKQADVNKQVKVMKKTTADLKDAKTEESEEIQVKRAQIESLQSWLDKFREENVEECLRSGIRFKSDYVKSSSFIINCDINVMSIYNSRLCIDTSFLIYRN